MLEIIFLIALTTLITSIVMKVRKKGKKNTTIAIIASIVIMVVVAPFVETGADTAPKAEKVAKVDTDDKQSEKEKATKEKEKAEKAQEKQTAKAKKEEAEKKAEEDKVAVEEEKQRQKEAEAEKAEADAANKAKEYYETNVQPQMVNYIAEYDLIWDELWAPTFNGIADGSVDVYTAYNNLGDLEELYRKLERNIADIKTDKKAQGKDDSDRVSSMRSNFANGAAMRKEAAKQARKMLDKGDFSPSEMEKIMDTISLSDNNTLQALAIKAELEMKYGLLDE